MKLTVVIVSYNVRYFLEKCILSVLKALEGIDGEVVVIDNQSTDTSVEMVRTRFPQVRLIANAENRGFAKACNQGLSGCNSKYALLLNPDTLVSEDTFRRCIEFMDEHPDASACGVRMVDGTGRFLPESMRGLPTPLSAFFKMTGINTMFPKSMFFNGYYMGAYDPDKMHKVPVLTGAFLFLRMEVIKTIGMLDEDYFMYGEDIDLCYRMVKAGYQNYYLPSPAIIHYKGESTHRGSIRYIIHFYKAMMIYVSKHSHGAGGQVFKIMILLAVWIRGILGGLKRVLIRILPVLVDAGIILGVLFFVKSFWSRIYFHDVDHFSRGFYRVNLPLYSITWLLFLFLSGAHDAQRNLRRILYGMSLGTIAILVVYAMLPLEYRSSRAVIVFSAILITSIMTLASSAGQYLLHRMRSHRQIAIVGSEEEVRRIMELMNRVEAQRKIVGWITTRDGDTGQALIGHVSQVADIVHQLDIGELIFSARDLTFGEINTWMSKIGPSIAYRIASSGSEQIVGSDSRKEQGTLYTADVEFALAYPSSCRAKRIFDVLTGVILLCLWPLTMLFRKRSAVKLKQILDVLKGRKTWIGYHGNDATLAELPLIRPGIVTAAGRHRFFQDSAEVHMINYIYAREYSVWKDMDLFLRNISQLI